MSPIQEAALWMRTDSSQGVAGLTERDIKLVQEGGFHTVESIAYTYAFAIT